jgi:hypothetical protein
MKYIDKNMLAPELKARAVAPSIGTVSAIGNKVCDLTGKYDGADVTACLSGKSEPTNDTTDTKVFAMSVADVLDSGLTSHSTACTGNFISQNAHGKGGACSNLKIPASKTISISHDKADIDNGKWRLTSAGFWLRNPGIDNAIIGITARGNFYSMDYVSDNNLTTRPALWLRVK